MHALLGHILCLLHFITITIQAAQVTKDNDITVTPPQAIASTSASHEAPIQRKAKRSRQQQRKKTLLRDLQPSTARIVENKRRYFVKKKELGLTSRQRLSPTQKHVSLSAIRAGLLSKDAFDGAQAPQKRDFVASALAEPEQEADPSTSIDVELKQEYLDRRRAKADLFKFAMKAPLPEEIKGIRLEELRERVRAAGGPREFFGGGQRYDQLVHESHEFVRHKSYITNERLRLLKQKYGRDTYPKKLLKKTLEEVEELTGLKAKPFEARVFVTDDHSPPPLILVIREGVTPARQKALFLWLPVGRPLPEFIAKMSVLELKAKIEEAGSARAFLGEEVYDDLLEKAREYRRGKGKGKGMSKSVEMAG